MRPYKYRNKRIKIERIVYNISKNQNHMKNLIPGKSKSRK